MSTSEITEVVALADYPMFTTREDGDARAMLTEILDGAVSSGRIKSYTIHTVLASWGVDMCSFEVVLPVDSETEANGFKWRTHDGAKIYAADVLSFCFKDIDVDVRFVGVPSKVSV